MVSWIALYPCCVPFKGNILQLFSLSVFLCVLWNSGRLHMFHVKDSELESACPLMGGHTAIVRCLQWDHKVSVWLLCFNVLYKHYDRDLKQRERSRTSKMVTGSWYFLSFGALTRQIRTAGVKTKAFRFVVWDKSLPSSETSNLPLLFMTSGNFAQAYQ